MNHLNRGPAPRKRFGQHFLRDMHYIRCIVDAIRPQREDAMLEIGPGRGALTLALLPALHVLHAVEFDRDMIAILQAYSDQGLVLHQADALRFDYAALSQALGKPLRVVGNLPYNISTPLIFHLLAAEQAIADMHFMLQKEVVDRLAAAPGGKTYGRLSVMVQLVCRVTPLFQVPPGAFFPPPKVDSRVVRLQPLETPRLSADMHDRFSRVVAAAFAQRRKTLSNTLKGLISYQQIQDCGLDPACRAEQLAVADFMRLTQQVSVDIA